MGFSHTDAVRVASTLQNGTIVVMPPNGIVRGGGSSSTSNRVGAATAPVVFFDEEFDADGNQLGGFFGPTTGEFDYATTVNLNDTVSPVANGGWFVNCVQNTSNATVQVAFNLIVAAYPFN